MGSNWQWILSPSYTIVIGQSPDGKVQKQDQEVTGSSVASGGHGPRGKKLSGAAETENRSPPLATFEMPLHYPRYKKADYEKMEEWKVDMLLREYGLNLRGSLEEKRKFAMGAFLWPDQL